MTKSDDVFHHRVLDIHTRQLVFSFRILMVCFLVMIASVTAPLLYPTDELLNRLKVLEETDQMAFVKTMVTTIVGAAIGLALGSFYNPSSSGNGFERSA